jgi:hypothetical protein
MVWPAAVTESVEVWVLVTARPGAGAIVVVTVLEVSARTEASGAVADAVAVFAAEPASTSAWVTVWA